MVNHDCKQLLISESIIQLSASIFKTVKSLHITGLSKNVLTELWLCFWSTPFNISVITFWNNPSEAAVWRKD